MSYINNFNYDKFCNKLVNYKLEKQNNELENLFDFKISKLNEYDTYGGSININALIKEILDILRTKEGESLIHEIDNELWRYFIPSFTIDELKILIKKGDEELDDKEINDKKDSKISMIFKSFGYHVSGSDDISPDEAKLLELFTIMIEECSPEAFAEAIEGISSSLNDRGSRKILDQIKLLAEKRGWKITEKFLIGKAVAEASNCLLHKKNFPKLYRIFREIIEEKTFTLEKCLNYISNKKMFFGIGKDLMYNIVEIDDMEIFLHNRGKRDQINPIQILSLDKEPLKSAYDWLIVGTNNKVKQKEIIDKLNQLKIAYQSSQIFLSYIFKNHCDISFVYK